MRFRGETVKATALPFATGIFLGTSSLAASSRPTSVAPELSKQLERIWHL
jgi:hypothetical protein